MRNINKKTYGVDSCYLSISLCDLTIIVCIILAFTRKLNAENDCLLLVTSVVYPINR